MTMRARGLNDLGQSDFVSSFANAIARFEGYNVAGSLAQRNNNPGNLRSGPGQTGVDANGYAVFPDAATGFAALDNQISLNISRGLTLNQFFAGEPGVYAGYAPSADANNPAQYASTVAGWLGVDPNTPLQDIASSGDFRPVPLSPRPAEPERTNRGT
jgi:hypothetical protein